MSIAPHITGAHPYKGIHLVIGLIVRIEPQHGNHCLCKLSTLNRVSVEHNLHVCIVGNSLRILLLRDCNIVVKVPSFFVHKICLH